MTSLEEKVSRHFEARFGCAPTLIARAPGRVNLIGEHTDYNDGYVLPMAIDHAVWIAFRPRADRLVTAHSLDYDQEITFPLDALHQEAPGWIDYLKGTAWALQEAGYPLFGWDGMIAGDVPLGAGLSSSAALELATARTFAAASALPWNVTEMAKICQRAEVEWVGMKCGIMDQMISAAGTAGHALLIDCRSLETETVPLPPGVSIVVLDTATRRGLVDSDYNERRDQCEQAARHFGVPALRDVDWAAFQARAGTLDPISYRRARHVISENARTLQAVQVMQQGDASQFGRLIDDSHRSLRDDFEVSSFELDLMVDCARREESCFGARMTGAGFGGCAVALVQNGKADGFAQHVAASYQKESGLAPSIYVCRAANGAEILPAPQMT